MITWSYTLSAVGPPVSTAVLSQALALGYKDIALDPVTGDFSLPIRLLVGADAILQRVDIRWQWFLGEWFLDQRLGIPYRERVLIKNPSLAVVRKIFRDSVLTTPGVLAVRSMTLDLNSATRTLTIPDVSFVVDGGVIISAVGAPFIVPTP